MSFKLKGIELNAFRIYQERELFNFQTVSGEVANLVVIYAPNGYGKTSFVDGVEWALTGDITRISGNSTIKNTADSEKGVILKNRHSDKEYGTVKIIAENGEYLEKNTKVLGRNGRKTDYADGDIVIKGDIFKDLDSSEFSTRSILGQDKIDSFLRSMNPRDRYETLANFWDDDNDSGLFKNILSMSSESEKKLSDVQRKIKEINEEIHTLVIRPDILSKINELVEKFNKIKLRDFKLPRLEKDNNKEFISVLIELNSKFDTLKSEVEEKLTESKFLLDNYTTFKNKERELELIKQTIIEQKDILHKFKEKEESQKALNITTYDSYELHKKYKKFKSLIKLYKDYENILSEINTREQVIRLKTKKISNLVDLKTNIEHNIKKMKKNIENIQTQKTEAEIRLSQLDVNLQEYIKLKKDKLHYNKRLLQLKDLMDVRWNKKELIKKEKTILESYFKYEVENIHNLNLDKADHEIWVIVKEIKNCLKSSSEKQKRIRELEQDYDKCGKLNDQLNTIYKVGKKLIEDSHTNTCPLCKQEYEDFNILIKNINKEFVEVDKLEKIRKEIETQNAVLKSEEDKILQLYNSFNREIDYKINDLLEQELKNEQKIASCNHLQQKFDKKLANAKDKELFLSTYFEKFNIEIEDYNLNDISSLKGIIQDQINNLDNSYIKNTNELRAQIERQSKVNNDLQNIESEIINNKNKVRELKEDQTLSGVAELLEDLRVSDDNFQIKEAYQSLKSEFALQLNNRRVILNKIDSLIKELETYKKDEIMQEFEANQTTHKEIQMYIDNFKVRITNFFNRENNIKVSIISEKHSEITNENHSLKTAFSILRELTEFTNYIENNIASKTKKSKKKDFEEELVILQKSNEELLNAKQYVTSFIQNKINKTFNLDSINGIYQRIDPHPDLNNIKFETDFQKDKPELNIYASSRNEVVAPVLYFSAAQVNILSLSIFLAKALLKNQKGLNTIFMDDPIQHLDNLNILSFIDLLRTITNQLDKQIILSTHNENFYKLIKRKLDPVYTNSKFIELESFGKIRR
jgi:DNA repair protein SbcC/Rad50